MAAEILVLLIEHDGDDSPSVALARNRAELLEQVKVAVWGEPHPEDTTNDAGDDMAEGMTDVLLETGVMTFEGDPPLRLVRIPVAWEPSVYIVYAPNGHVRLWSREQWEANQLAAATGLTVTPLHALGVGASSETQPTGGL